MNESTEILVDRDGAVAIVTLNRPNAKNALTPTMVDTLTGLFVGFARDDGIRSVILTGAGSDFCAGGDVKAMGQGGPRTPEQRRAGMAPYGALTSAIAELDKPVIAAIDGVAFGAGVSLALLADIVLVSNRARMALVFHRVGLVPDLGAWYSLPRVVGLQRAKELIYSAREFDASEAKEMGLALEVLPPDTLMSRARAFADSFAATSETAFSLSKQALRRTSLCDLKTMLEMEAAAQAIAAGSEYTRESIRRFAAKEPAQFSWPSPQTN